MDPFERPYWSKLQVELWVCTRSRQAVRLAEHAPGRTRLADTSIGPDGLHDEAYDQDSPMFEDDIELIGTTIINYGSVCQFEDAQKAVIVALSNGGLQQHQDRSRGVEFFERAEVLRIWPDPRLESLRAKAGPLELAEGLALLVHGRPASSKVWLRLLRRHGGRFPEEIQKRIEEVGQAIVGMIRDGTVEAFGFRCHRDGGLGSLNPSTDEKERVSDDQAFLRQRLWVDPCTDAIWTEPELGDGRFNPTDRGYRYICLSRTEFLDAVWSYHTNAEVDCKPGGRQRSRTIAGIRKQVFGPAAVLMPRPERSVVHTSVAEVPSEASRVNCRDVVAIR